jgi:SAM-dependent methyltransferase
VSFVVAADSYDRFMGRYSVPLAAEFADFAGVASGHRVLDVGCGPGALTTELVRRLGAAAVTAVDPSEPFVAAARERHPGVDVRLASADELPFAEDGFDTALAQLVVHFMADPVAGLRELARVTRVGGVVAACVWDHAGGRSPLSVFWEASHRLDASAADESHLPGAREGHLAELFAQAGLDAIEQGVLTVSVEHPSFEEWWEPYTLGVAPAGAYIAKLEPEVQTRFRELCRELLPPAPFVLDASVWAVRGRAL